MLFEINKLRSLCLHFAICNSVNAIHKFESWCITRRERLIRNIIII